jgi:hypothetical protein
MFSNKSFRKEVNCLAKKSSKKIVLDMYATASKREKQKLQKQIAKCKPREVARSDSNDDISLCNVEPAKARKSSIKSKTRTTDERSSTKAKTHTTDDSRTEKARTTNRTSTGRRRVPEKITLPRRPLRIRQRRDGRRTDCYRRRTERY